MTQPASIRVVAQGDGFIEVCFDRCQSAVNTLDAHTIEELRALTASLRDDTALRGVLVTSAKDSFIVGADIFEFTALFDQTCDEIAAFNAGQSAVFSAFGDLPVPIVVAINGLALGGGFEIALAADYRVAADDARVGLPEVSLGIIPGFGGTVRLPRLIGAAPALSWIASGKPQTAAAALEAGAVDAVVPLVQLRAAALATLRVAADGDDWLRRRSRRQGAIGDFDHDAFAALKAQAQKVAGHYPAALTAAEAIEAGAVVARDAALVLESLAFGRIARTPTAAALVQLFINEQLLKKKGRGYAEIARPIRRGAVLGAGIMGGGIAYASAARGVPVLMKDITQPALDLGRNEARKLGSRQVAAGRMQQAQANAIAEAIVPTLDYQNFDTVDVVVEAVVENLTVKKAVLADVEARVRPDVVLASNTSSLSIAELGTALQRPGNFVGMHFFNPVPVMPLVEVIRGPQTSDAAAATVAGYAARMGKTPVLVRDCAGFLVNRILTAYFVGFLRLIHDGGDFEMVDRAMEAFGWPMGPATLQDVIGMDTSDHVVRFIAAAYPQRMRMDFTHAIAQMAAAGRYGQKSGRGFYRYASDDKGRPVKRSDVEAGALLATVQAPPRPFADAEIVDRLMLPMIVEASTCLEEGIADTPAEIDMSLILGIGFPRHYGGALKYADLLGLAAVVERCDALAALGGGYRPTAQMRRMAEAGTRFHG